MGKVADSGTSVSIIPVNIAKRNGIKWRALDPDEPNFSGVTVILDRPTYGSSSKT